MFEQLKRELERIAATKEVSVPMEADAEGYLDKECPSAECLFGFKVLKDDWRHKVRDEQVFCPFCGHTAKATSWYSTQQIEAAKKTVVEQMQNRINTAMKRDADAWNRRQRPGFLSITMKVDSQPRHVFVPPMAAEPMRLKMACTVCGCRYAVIGAAFFCPACGHNAADVMFTQSLQGIRSALDAIPSVRTAIDDRDTAETTVRLLVENGLQNAITAFQRYAEALYAMKFPGLPAPRRNAFQNLGEGSTLWQNAAGKQYSDYLDTTELAALTRNFQQRHLLAHRQGLVDADYIARSGDRSYREGQRLVVREPAVRECVALIEKLGKAMA